jgi:hypothetical protein
MRSADSSDPVRGFSQNTHEPARIAWMASGSCRWGGVAITTMSGFCTSSITARSE